MPRWARTSGWSGGRLTVTVLAVQGWCPHCGRDLEHQRGGRFVGTVVGDCPVHGTVDHALTA